MLACSFAKSVYILVLSLAMRRGVAGRSPLEVGSSSLDQASLAALSLGESGSVTVRT